MTSGFRRTPRAEVSGPLTLRNVPRVLRNRQSFHSTRSGPRCLVMEHRRPGAIAAKAGELHQRGRLRGSGKNISSLRGFSPHDRRAKSGAGLGPCHQKMATWWRLSISRTARSTNRCSPRRRANRCSSRWTGTLIFIDNWVSWSARCTLPRGFISRPRISNNARPG